MVRDTLSLNTLQYLPLANGIGAITSSLLWSLGLWHMVPSHCLENTSYPTSSHQIPLPMRTIGMHLLRNLTLQRSYLGRSKRNLPLFE
ncbi:hypothetical protein BDZ94DRAFT_1265241 [Collybia nuda]|uniref:Uncharacterized protein n=1 Tax=Collybia nuda TaxID=64659 RepID=A0A9P5XZX6_9AGAR|nr:hypothetical protein BDZ94DRAFT_1265241 [Collybia nuda]